MLTQSTQLNQYCSHRAHHNIFSLAHTELTTVKYNVAHTKCIRILKAMAIHHKVTKIWTHIIVFTQNIHGLTFQIITNVDSSVTVYTSDRYK